MKFRRFRTPAALMAAGMALASTSACGASGGGSDVFAIGAIRPASGAMAQYGAQFSAGISQAVKEANDAGGIEVNGKKVKVEVKYCDSQADAAQATTCGRKLSSDGVPVELASLSIEAFPLLAFNDSGRNPSVVIAGSASNKLVTQGNSMVARYWFNSYGYMPGFTKLLSQLLDQQGGSQAKTVAILQSEDEYGEAWNETFRSGWKALGNTVPRTATFATNSTDVYPQITALLKDRPAIIALPGNCPTIIPGVKQARELGFKGRFIFAASCTPSELIAAVGEKAIAGSIFEGTAWDSGSAAATAVKDDLKKATGKEPGILVGVAYAFAKWAMASAEKAGTTTDARKIRAAMAGALHDANWNILGLSALQKNGETSAPIYPRLFKSTNDIVNFTGQA
ncbi:ABC transporter substrate-binding protein [Streptomyces sp. NPDC005708]|uniref:ABC transporter substrate-binding protein n=1 Tax=Streptomyces sp. NPDC005708 TaxID=3154564 RepID=UPI0033E29788